MIERRLLAIGFLAVLTAFMSAVPAGASQSSFRNPVLPESATGNDSPDPWMFRADGKYWLTYTTAGHVEVRSAKVVAGLASATPVNLWPPEGTTEPAERSLGVWAPEIHRVKGPNGWRWYVYYSATGPDSVLGADTHRMYVLESKSKSPAGPYRFKGRLMVPEPYAIDATVGYLNGQLYLFYAGGTSWNPTSILVMKMSNPWTVQGEPTVVSEPTESWEKVVAPINEGPEILIRGKRLHLIYSGSWCGSGQYAMGRLSVPLKADLMDPAVWSTAKVAGAVFAGDPERGVFGPGHGSFFTSPNGRESWMVYHATEDIRGCFTGGLRTTRIQRFGWNPDGTPNFRKPVSLATDVAAPGGDRTIAVQTESALAPSASATRLEERQFFGYAGMTLTPSGPNSALRAIPFEVPKTGTYLLWTRVMAGPDSPPLTWLRPDGRKVSRKTRRPAPQAIEIKLGKARLNAGTRKLRLRSTAPVSIDQLRLQPAARDSTVHAR